jgi:hypothetical protein
MRGRFFRLSMWVVGSSRAHRRGKKTAVQTNIVGFFYSKCFHLAIEIFDSTTELSIFRQAALPNNAPHDVNLSPDISQSAMPAHSNSRAVDRDFPPAGLRCAIVLRMTDLSMVWLVQKSGANLRQRLRTRAIPLLPTAPRASACRRSEAPSLDLRRAGPRRAIADRAWLVAIQRHEGRTGGRLHQKT